MNAVHLHLMVNHVPIAATWLAVPVLLLALVRLPNRDAWLCATLLLTIASLAAAVTYWTGEPAEEAVEDIEGVDLARLEAHEEYGRTGAICGVTGGVIALAAWAGSLKAGERGARTAITATLVAAVVSGSVLSWVGYSGGLIRHPEILEP